ncbi:hypothetical protein [Streptomyces sp. STCH 565 A]|uniref:hypothetical protein n=1 Tax=Streptomyces sp. STCH 565 A TaxID=2950532 RepID=UPI002074F932|nr:hypothetical protein [Streptomyces sp. STCH 565 A]MCM8548957.1 hypothetical protein [Streptomyces sp. STCH 565 A]
MQGEDLERLAVELAPAVKALIAEATDAHAETVPVRYAVVATQDEQAGVHTTTFASTARIGMDVDPTSPAALLAAELRAHQADVRATDVPSPTYLGLTIRPQSLHAWRWWIDKLGIHPDAVTLQDTAAYATGTLGDVVIAVQADEVPALLVDEAAARLLGLIAETTPDPA